MTTDQDILPLKIHEKLLTTCQRFPVPWLLPFAVQRLKVKGFPLPSSQTHLSTLHFLCGEIHQLNSILDERV